MILRFLPSGISNGDAPIRYLLSKKDSKGAERIPPPVVLYGDPEVTKALIDTCPRKFKYTSAVIAFRDNEHPTNRQIDSVMHDLKDTLAPGMVPDRVDMLAVLHRDKGNTEIHIIFSMTDQKTGKQYNVMPPGKAGKQLASDWQAHWNHKFGYDQVVTNPLKTHFSSLDFKVAKFSKPTDLMNKRLRVKKNISDLVISKIESGRIINRDDLIEFFQESGMTITRTGRDYISVRGSDPKLKPVRLKGEMYSEGVDYSQLLKKAEENAESGSKLSPTDAFLVELRLKRAILDRESFIRDRDNKIPKKRAYTLPGHPKAERQPRVKVLTRREKATQAFDRIQSKLNELRSMSESDSEDKGSISASHDHVPTLKPKHTNIYSADLGKSAKKSSEADHSNSFSGSLPSTDLEASIAQVESEIRGATVAMNSAKSPQAAVKAKLKLIELAQKLYALQERARQERIRALNMPKPIPGFI